MQELTSSETMVHVGKYFSKNYGLCGKICKKEKLQHKCGILRGSRRGKLA